MGRAARAARGFKLTSKRSEGRKEGGWGSRRIRSDRKMRRHASTQNPNQRGRIYTYLHTYIHIAIHQHINMSRYEHSDISKYTHILKISVFYIMLKNNCIHPTQIALKLNWTTVAYLQLEMINQHLGHSCQVHNSVLNTQRILV